MMENSKRDDFIIVGSDIRALCMEIKKLEKERDDPLEQARRELPVFSALRDEVAKWKANHDNQVAIKRAVLDRPDLGDRAASVLKLFAERDAALARCGVAERRGREINEEANQACAATRQATAERDAARAELAALRASEALIRCDAGNCALSADGVGCNTMSELAAARAEVERLSKGFHESCFAKQEVLQAEVTALKARKVTLPARFNCPYGRRFVASDDGAWLFADSVGSALRAAGVEVAE